MDPLLTATLFGTLCFVLGIVLGRISMPSTTAQRTIRGLEEDLIQAHEKIDRAKAELNGFKESDDFSRLLSTEFARGKLEGQSTAVVEFKSSDDLANLLSIEHDKGKRAGAAEELEKFQITYTPIIVDIETFLSRKIDIGYDMQIHYAGFPIGEATRRITNRQEKSKDENIKMLLDTVNKTLELVGEVAAKSGIPITIGKTPKRVARKK